MGMSLTWIRREHYRTHCRRFNAQGGAAIHKPYAPGTISVCAVPDSERKPGIAAAIQLSSTKRSPHLNLPNSVRSMEGVWGLPIVTRFSDDHLR